eukprot:1801683-Rhodomonas_salina.1
MDASDASAKSNTIYVFYLVLFAIIMCLQNVVFLCFATLATSIVWSASALVGICKQQEVDNKMHFSTAMNSITLAYTPVVQSNVTEYYQSPANVALAVFGGMVGCHQTHPLYSHFVHFRAPDRVLFVSGLSGCSPQHVNPTNGICERKAVSAFNK